MANRDLFSGADYPRGERRGRGVGRIVWQGLAAALLFGGVLFLYEQESDLGEGVRYVVALAQVDNQEALAVNGLADWADFFAAAKDEAEGEVINEGANEGANEGVDDEENEEEVPTAAKPDNYVASAKDEGDVVLILPTSGLMQAAFGELSEEGLPVEGVEIFCQQEQTIKAAAIGEVVAINEVSGGKSLTLRHSGGVETVYQGAISPSVKPGDVLKQGEAIATMGEGVLLFQVLVEGEAADPLAYVLAPEG